MDASEGVVAALADPKPGITSASPLYRQIYSVIARAVLDGRLAPGTRLPSGRSLAAQLSVARGTAETADQMLVSEGYLVSRGAAGTRVNPGLAGQVLNVGRADAGHAGPSSASERAPTAEPGAFAMGVPAMDAFPHKLWSRLVAHNVRAFGPADLAYQDPAGYPPLRTQIAGYLAVARGVACTPPSRSSSPAAFKVHSASSRAPCWGRARRCGWRTPATPTLVTPCASRVPGTWASRLTTRVLM